MPAQTSAVITDFSLISDSDVYLFNEGTHSRLWEKLGAHEGSHQGESGVCFSVWAPNARYVSVIGDWNGWNRGDHQLKPRGDSGIWEGFIPGVAKGSCYKFYIESHHRGYRAEKSDPFAMCTEVAPRTGSIVANLDHNWNDAEWMERRRETAGLQSPISIYEVHLGSWKRHTWSTNFSYSYRELADSLVPYVKEMGFTHVELLPVMEHPFFGSWGYQTTGFFAPTSRYGSPQDFMHLVETFHQHGIGVILDWVPSHFPTDEHGLGYFDGTHLFEHEDPRLGFHPDWNSNIFNYGRNEVRSFLVSSALFWLDRYHIDGIRVDAVASMLYRDYSRKAGEWIPNQFGGRENLEAIALLRQLNEAIYSGYPGVQTYAEESTAWPMVSRPTYVGGLGFGFKWDMGWMHDTLKYIAQDPIYRRYHHHELTFRMIYAFNENFVLPLSHDEVVHGKGSLLGKMPGDEWRKFANLRLLYLYMWTQPGKKLLFMGCEFAQLTEWVHDRQLQWELLEFASHAQIRLLVGELNRVYRTEPALHRKDSQWDGFEWIDCQDAEDNVIAFLRKHEEPEGTMLVICNFSPVPRPNYRVGVPEKGLWREILNTDAPLFGGTGTGNYGGVESVPIPVHGRSHSLTITLPPLGGVIFRWC